eukprot:368967-Ditylum_brightwellii.AAC.1
MAPKYTVPTVLSQAHKWHNGVGFNMPLGYHHLATTPLPLVSEASLVLPDWIVNQKKVTFELDGNQQIRYLYLHDSKWQFSPQDGISLTNIPILGLAYQHLLDSQLLLPEWNHSFIPATAAVHVSTAGLTLDCLEFLTKVLKPSFSDWLIWHQSYMKELNGLLYLQVFWEITAEQYYCLCSQGGPRSLQKYSFQILKRMKKAAQLKPNVT